MTTLAQPKAAAQFIEEAKQAGFTIKIQETSASYEVEVEKEHHHPGKKVWAHLVWSQQNVAGNNSRLGFPTAYKAGVRFDYASTHYYGWDRTSNQMGWQHGFTRSARQVKIQIGIPT